MRGQVIAFSPSNIANFLSCSHYANIEDTRLEGDFDINAVANVLTRDEEAHWLETNRLQSAQLLLEYRAL